MNRTENYSDTLHIPYLFVHLLDDTLSEKTIETIHQSKEVHFYLENSLNDELIRQLKQLPQLDYYMYVFNKESYDFCINNKITPHICFSGEEIFSSPLLNISDNSLEFFWFPGIDDIFHNIDDYSSQLKKINKPICISISDIFNPEVNHEQSRLWIKSLLETYKNPLFEKEKELLKEDGCSKDNKYLRQENQENILKTIVLGMFGDCVIEENFEINNLKSIIVNKDCSNCDYQELCINKGLGYSLYKNKYKGCIGIKLFNQE